MRLRILVQLLKKLMLQGYTESHGGCDRSPDDAYSMAPDSNLAFLGVSVDLHLTLYILFSDCDHL
jgi:hypothetical protein